MPPPDGLTFNDLVPQRGQGQSPQPASNSDDDYYQQAGDAYAVDPDLLRAHEQVESGGDDHAVSDQGAKGRMQFMPATAREMGIRDTSDKRQSIFGAARYLRTNMDMFGRPDLAVAAYHGGPDPQQWGPKTRAYVQNVSDAYQTLKAGRAQPWHPAPWKQLPPAEEEDTSSMADQPDGGELSFDDLVPKQQGNARSQGANNAQQAEQPPVELSFDDLVPKAAPQSATQAQLNAFARGLESGAGNFLRGVGQAVQSAGPRNIRAALSVMDRIDAGETVPAAEDALGYQDMNPEQRAKTRAQFSGALPPQTNLETPAPGPVMRAGEPGAPPPGQPRVDDNGQSRVSLPGIDTLSPFDAMHLPENQEPQPEGARANLQGIGVRPLDTTDIAQKPDLTPPEAPNWAQRAGGKLVQDAEGRFHVAPEQEGLATHVMGMLGGIAPIIAGGAAATMLGGPVAGAAVVTPVIWAQSYDQTFQDARAKGATAAQADSAALDNAATQAALMSAPVARLFQSVPMPFREGLMRTLINLGQHGVEFGSLSALGQFAGNYIARQTYDPERPMMAGVGDAALEGTITGLIVPALTGGFHAARGEPAAPRGMPDLNPGMMGRPAEIAGSTEPPPAGPSPSTPTPPPSTPAAPPSTPAPGSSTPRPSDSIIDHAETHLPSMTEPVRTVDEIEEEDHVPPPAAQAEHAAEQQQAAQPVPVTTPEPAADVHAQMAAVMDPANPKDAAFFAPSTPLPRIPPRSGLMAAQREEGTLVSNNPEKIAAFQNAPVVNDALMAQLLGYPETKPEAIASGNPVVVQATDQHGAPVTQMLSSPDKVAEASAVAAEQKPPGGAVEVTTPQAAQEDRTEGGAPVAGVGAPAEQPKPPAPPNSVQPTGLIDIDGIQYAITRQEPPHPRGEPTYRALDLSGNILAAGSSHDEVVTNLHARLAAMQAAQEQQHGQHVAGGTPALPAGGGRPPEQPAATATPNGAVDTAAPAPKPAEPAAVQPVDVAPGGGGGPASGGVGVAAEPAVEQPTVPHPVYRGQPIAPLDLAHHAQIAADDAREQERLAGIATVAKKKTAHLEAAKIARGDAGEMGRILNEWKAAHPEEAAKLFPAAPAVDPAEAEHADWWDNRLTRFGRGEVMKKAGVAGTPASTLWRDLAPDVKAAVAPHMGAVAEAKPSAAPADQGPHYAAGLSAKQEGKPRTLPSYFTGASKNSRDWLRGWDAGVAPEAKPAAAAKPGDGGWKPMLPNVYGHELFIDKNGVRSYVNNGVRHTETVGFRPTKGGMQIELRPLDQKPAEFLTAQEYRDRVHARKVQRIEAAYKSGGIKEARKQFQEYEASLNINDASLLETDAIHAIYALGYDGPENSLSSRVPPSATAVTQPAPAEAKPTAQSDAQQIAEEFRKNGAAAANELFKQIMADRNLTHGELNALRRYAHDAMKAAGWKGGSDEPAPTRQAQILAELDARQAPDEEYRSAFSTGSKIALKPGETWRQRLVDWVARQQRGEQEEAAPQPEPGPNPNHQPGAEPPLPPEDTRTEREKEKERLRAKLRNKFSQLNAGMDLDPETFQDAVRLTVMELEDGFRAFRDYAGRMIEGIGREVIPFLRPLYEAARWWPGFDNAGMSQPHEIEQVLREGFERPTSAEQETEHGLQGPLPEGNGGTGAEHAEPTAPSGEAGRPPAGQEPGGAPDAGRPSGEGTPEQVRGGEQPGGASGSGGSGAGNAAGLPAGARPRKGRATRRPPEVVAADIRGQNYRIEPGALEETRSPRIKARDNLEAIKLAKRLTAEGAAATQAEQAILAKYVGWGGLSGAFEVRPGQFGAGLEDVGRELKTVLTPEEHAAAKESTQFAHYTAEHVINSMWNAVEAMGFKGGSVFEPGMGVGHFLGLMPDSIAGASQYRGLEMDNVSAAIARLLYPQSGVEHGNFITTPMPDGAFDLVIGNPPFSDVVIRQDPKYRARGFMLHDYFFAKSLDSVRPGGLMAFVTSAGTMNKMDPAARRYLAERSELLGGVRLPSSAFKQNAGTEVTTDILFFQRRPEGRVALTDEDVPDWTKTVVRELPSRDGGTHQGYVSQYFTDHPEQVLGQEGFFDKLAAGLRYGVRPEAGRDLVTDLQAAVARLPRDVMTPPQTPEQRAALDFQSGQTKDGSFYIDPNGRLMQYSGGAGRLAPRRGGGVKGGYTAPEMDRIRLLVPIRDALRDVFRHDLAENEEAANAARAALNQHYDRFVAKFGPINKAEFQYRRPTIVQQETARQEAREEARERGEYFDRGDFDDTDLIEKKATTADIARARQAARDAAAAAGKPFGEGTFNPDDMADVVIEKRPNIAPFADDPESYRLRSIEEYDDSTGEARKRDIFDRNILRREKEPEIKSANDGVLWSFNNFGRFDLDKIAEKMGVSRDSILNDLGDRVFKTPQGKYVTADEYLSGDVVAKLAEARVAAESDPELRRNIPALEGAQPVPLAPSEIAMMIGMPWIPIPTISKFVAEHLGLGRPHIEHSPVLGTWFVQSDLRYLSADKTALERWGTPDRNAYELLSDAINRTPPRIYQWEGFGSDRRRVFDPIATQSAEDRVQQIKNAFTEYVNADTDLGVALAAEYNARLNRVVLRQYDGSYLTTPGIAASWQWRPHQRRVVARIIQDGNTYMAHAVGAGKTSSSIGAAMEMRRLGLVRKPMFVVPKHILGQFAKEFYEQYPLARVRVAQEEEFHTDRRKQFIANVALEDLDAVIVTHPSFGKIPISREFEEGIIREQIEQIDEAMQGLNKWGDDRYTVKKLENQKAKLIQRLSRSTDKQDQTVTFEEMGVDFLFVDEAHGFRKLAFGTKQGTMKGIDSDGSAMAMDLYMKARYLDQQKPGRSLVMMSGTPITNTMGELYTLSRYIQPQALADRNISHFDSWSQTFGDTATTLEQTPAGTYNPVTRFSKFVNLPELYKMVGAQMDIVTSAELAKYVTRPKLAGGERKLHMAPRTDALDEYQARLGARMKAIAARRGPPQKGDDILLSVIGDGRHSAIDMRFVEIGQNDPRSKLNMMISNVANIWRDSTNQQFYHAREGYKDPAFRGPATQMIFMNLGVNGRGPMGFNGYDWIKEALRREGIPPDQIAVIGDYKGSVARQRLFNDMNEGKVRVLIGSVQKMGTGVNAQRRLLAIHNADPLWYPADDEQRVGRGLRQGNMNPELQVHDYTTKGTYDATMWQMMGRKGRFIEQFFRGDPDLRDMEDLGEASMYEQASAMSTSDPRIMELTDLKQQLEKAERRHSAFDREQFSLRMKRDSSQSMVRWYQNRAIYWAELEAASRPTRGDQFSMRIGDQAFAKRKDAAEALEVHVKALLDAGIGLNKRVMLGEIGGFPLALETDKNGNVDYGLVSPENKLIEISGGMGEMPRLIRNIEDWIADLPNDRIRALASADEYQKTADSIEPLLDRQFEGGPEIVRLREAVRAMETALKAEADAKKAPPAVPPPPGPQMGRRAPATQEFDRWFSGSKVVDADGQPKVMYHGSFSPAIEAFDPAHAGQEALYGPGFYFTDNTDVAGSTGGGKDEDDIAAKAFWNLAGYAWQGAKYDAAPLTPRQMAHAKRLMWGKDLLRDAYEDIGARKTVAAGQRAFQAGEPEFRKWLTNGGYRWVRDRLRVDRFPTTAPTVYPVYLSIKNPFEAERRVSAAQATELVEQGLRAAPADPNRPAWRKGEALDTMQRRIRSWGEQVPQSAAFEALSAELGKPDAVRALQAMGYDGIHYEGGNMVRTFGNHDVWMAFEPTQIKSAVGNRGTFSPEDPRLNFGRQPARVPLYSAVARAVDALPQARGTGEQMLAAITKAPGVKPEEVKWLGLAEWLRPQAKVTREQIADYVRANALDVREVTKGEDLAAKGAFERAGEDRLKAMNDMQAAMAANRHAVEINGDRLYVDEVARGLEDGEFQPTTLPDVPGLREAAARYVSAHHASERALRSWDASRKDSAARYGEYQLFGGEGYRELLMTLPENTTRTDHLDAEARRLEAAGDPRWREVAAERGRSMREQTPYRSSHWDEPNVLAHIRFSERRAPDGKRVLLIEEGQSDWHQKGRKEGYATPTPELNERNLAAAIRAELPNADADAIAAKVASTPGWTRGNTAFLRVDLHEAGVDFDSARRIGQRLSGELNKGLVPDAPFKTSWPALIMKRMIQYAVDNGFDRVAWTPGDVQADRYDLSKSVDYIEWNPETHDLSAYGPSGNVLIGKKVAPDELADTIGKEPAERLLKQETHGNSGLRVLEGDGLKVGGKGMRGFYDKILPAETQKIIGKFGGKVGKGDVDTSELDRFDIVSRGGRYPSWRIIEPRNGDYVGDNFQSREAAEAWLRENGPKQTQAVHSFDITPAMRDAIRQQGLPLFELTGQGNAGGRPLDPRAAQAIVDAAVKMTGGKARIEAYDAAHDVFRVQFDDGTVENVFGYVFGRLARFALDGKPGDAWHMGHEVMHVLRNMGVFTPAEWRTLEETAQRQGWAGKHNIRQRYGDDQPEDERLEEAIAEQFAENMTKPAEASSFMRRMIVKLRQFLARIRNALRGLGFQTAEDIFRKVQSGEVGAREMGQTPRKGPLTIRESVDAAREWQDYQAQMQGRSPSFGRRDTVETPEFRRWFGNSKVVDGNGDPLVVYHATDADIAEFSNRFAGANTDRNAASPELAETSRLGHWFSDQTNVAERTGASATYPVYLKIEHPLDTTLDDLVDRIAETGSAHAVVAELEGAGYDGLRVQDAEFGGTSFVAFKPEQIKSAIGNRGTFSADDPRIAFGRRPTPAAEPPEPGAEPPPEPPEASRTDRLISSLAAPLRAVARTPAMRRVLDSSAMEAAHAHIANLSSSIGMIANPMGQGTAFAQALAKDYANEERRISYQLKRLDDSIKKKYSVPQRREMAEALDEQSVADQRLRAIQKEHGGWSLVTADGELQRFHTKKDALQFRNGTAGAGPITSPRQEMAAMQEAMIQAGTGLGRVPEDQRAVIELLDRMSQRAWKDMSDLNIVGGTGLPHYMPRYFVNVLGEGGEVKRINSGDSITSLNPIGGNLSTSGPKRRKHLEREETAAAGRAKLGDNATLVTDIRALLVALHRSQKAIAGKRLIDGIRQAGLNAGDPTVTDSMERGFFTLDHPAFREWRPDLVKQEDGGYKVRKDEDGKDVMRQHQIYVSNAFEGPLRAILTSPMPPWYRALMSVKSTGVSIIMASPMTHNMVIFGKALDLMPGKMLTLQLYRDGHMVRTGMTYGQAIQEWRKPGTVPPPPAYQTGLMNKLISAGMVPINGGWMADLLGVAQEIGGPPGKGLISKGAGALAGAIAGQGAKDRTRNAIDAAGDFWHGTLLWDRIADLQAGLAADIYNRTRAAGAPDRAAATVAAHFANRFAGILPNESTSEWLRRAENLVLFSRQFTLGNLGIMKDALASVPVRMARGAGKMIGSTKLAALEDVGGLPSDVRAQLERDLGRIEAKAASNTAYRYAMGAFMKSMALFLGMNAVAQMGVQAVYHYLNDPDDDVMNKLGHAAQFTAEGFGRRLMHLVQERNEHPLSWLDPRNVLTIPYELSPTFENEPGSQNRIFVGLDAHGRGIYVRNPTGKVGEEFYRWLTDPLQQLKAKLSPFVRPLNDIVANRDYWGNKIYDEKGFGTMTDMQAMGRIMSYYLQAQVPLPVVEGGYDLVTGAPDPGMSFGKSVLPLLTGITTSRGNPAGPEAGIERQVMDRAQREFSAAYPQVADAVRRGDDEKAQKILTELGKTPREAAHIIMGIQEPQIKAAPRSRMSKEYRQYATPAEQERFEHVNR